MPDVALIQSGSANGTATPATMTLAGVTAGNLLLVLISAIGTSPTITAPTGDSWVVVQKTTGAVITSGMWMLKNAGAGSHTPSAVLGGTVTGWIISMFEFSATGANCGLQGKNQTAQSVAQLTNPFPTTGQTLSSELFVYSVVRATATITPQNTSNSPLAAWSNSVQSQAGVQGLSSDTYWLSTLGQGINQYPQASGLLSSGVASVQLAQWFNTLAQQPSNNDNIGGNNGLYVPVQYAGMIGG